MKKGISLIILIITIIVVIILAGAIILKINDTDIIESANNAVQLNNEQENRHAFELFKADIFLDRTGDFDETKLKADSSGNIYYDDNENEQLDDGEDINLDLADVVPAPDMVTNIESGSLVFDENEEENVLEIGVIATENRTLSGSVAIDNPIIPKGFKAVNTAGASWESLSEDYDSGLVIEDGNGNQFVWVPVDGTNVSYTKDLTYNWVQSGIVDGSLPSGVDDEQTQIDNYYGFYIGRYEAGKEGVDTLVSKTDIPVWTSITHIDAKTTAESMYTTSDYGVKSGLVTGKMWDATMDFVTLGGYNVLDITTWGNCNNTQSPANVDGAGNLQDTGYSEFWKANNIYNIAGNAREWINEVRDDCGIIRGGNIYSNGTIHHAGYRDEDLYASSYNNRGFRVALYIVN